MADEKPNFIPQVDYTSRDYETIREDLLRLIPLYTPSWTNRDTADFGMTLIELFSYMGDMLNFYIDRAANEGFLATASQRDSVLRIASLLNYTPTDSTPAVTTLTFVNTSATAKTVPARTQIATTTTVDSTGSQVIFETDSAVVVPAKVGGVNGTANVTATQGVTVTTTGGLGISNGNPNQVFKLPLSPVITRSIEVTVSGVNYTYSPYLIEEESFKTVFTTFTDSANSTYILFGDGIGGRIPPTSGVINATYRVGAGKSGNVPANKLTYFLTNFSAGLTVTNQSAASGGADPESTDSIRDNAPLALKSLNRAVSLKDYSSLALQVPGVSKAIAEAESYSSVVLYICPFGDEGSTIGGGTTAVFDELETRVVQYFVDKAPPNTSLTVIPPTYVPVNITVTINLLDKYKKSTLSNQALAVLRELFAIDNVFFGDRIALQYVITALSSITGIDYVTVDLLRKTSENQAFSISNKALTSNIATLTTSAAHTFTVGQKVRITGVDTVFNGDHIVLSTPTSTTFTFAKVNANVTSAAVSPVGTAQALVVEVVDCEVNEIPKEGTFTVLTVGGID
jgi:uncharacterized phage protein gp47/JayE